MSQAFGTNCIVLHGHLPYVHQPRCADFLEESWFLEAALETYLPLLFVLDELAAARVPVRLTVGLTPTLLEMFQSPTLQSKLAHFLSQRRELAEAELVRHKQDLTRQPVARHYAGRFLQLQQLYGHLDGNLVAGFRRHVKQGRLEIMASAATHPILPLLSSQELKQAQIRVGLALAEELFGCRPRGFWLPECAYAPGLDKLLQEEGVTYVILESHALLGASPPATAGTALPVRLPSGVAAWGRDRESSRQVWSAKAGYPGDPLYRELYRDLGFDGPYEQVRPYLHTDGVRRNLGIKYHRVTGDVPLHEKKLYDPVAARERARVHAADYLLQRARQARRLFDQLGAKPAILSPYDLELFGHWWYEGPHFLKALFNLQAQATSRQPVALRTPSEILAKDAPLQTVAPGPSTWGEEGFFKVWLNEKNAWILRHQQEAERRLLAAARAHPQRSPQEAPILDQMLRELFLLQASDWAFIITQGTTTHYAQQRVADAMHRFLRLEATLQDPASLDPAWFHAICEEDALFPGLDYRVVLGAPPRRAGPPRNLPKYLKSRCRVAADALLEGLPGGW